MKSHIPPSLRDLCMACIDAGEKCITACQDVVAVCSGSELVECAEQIGILVARCQASIEACKNYISSGVAHAEQCDNKECIKLSRDAVNACEQSLIVCEKCIEKCKSGENVCVDNCLSCIQACQICVQACNSLINLTD